MRVRGDGKELCQEQSVPGYGLRLSSDLLWSRERVSNAKLMIVRVDYEFIFIATIHIHSKLLYDIHRKKRIDTSKKLLRDRFLVVSIHIHSKLLFAFIQ